MKITDVPLAVRLAAFDLFFPDFERVVLDHVLVDPDYRWNLTLATVLEHLACHDLPPLPLLAITVARVLTKMRRRRTDRPLTAAELAVEEAAQRLSDALHAAEKDTYVH